LAEELLASEEVLCCMELVISDHNTVKDLLSSSVIGDVSYEQATYLPFHVSLHEATLETQAQLHEVR
jgi:hypothetical protein